LQTSGLRLQGFRLQGASRGFKALVNPMAYDKIARQRERRAEQRGAKKALEARLQTLKTSGASSHIRGDVCAAKVAKRRPRNAQAENQFVVVQTIQPAFPSDALIATGPRQIGQYDPPTRWHRWREHDIII